MEPTGGSTSVFSIQAEQPASPSPANQSAIHCLTFNGTTLLPIKTTHLTRLSTNSIQSSLPLQTTSSKPATSGPTLGNSTLCVTSNSNKSIGWAANCELNSCLCYPDPSIQLDCKPPIQTPGTKSAKQTLSNSTIGCVTTTLVSNSQTSQNFAANYTGSNLTATFVPVLSNASGTGIGTSLALACIFWLIFFARLKPFTRALQE